MAKIAIVKMPQILSNIQSKRDDADIHFMVGGTQTNIAVITAILKHHQGTICAESGHINAHETGALESVGINV